MQFNYVGHAEQWYGIALEGDIAASDCLLRYKSRGRVLAAASIYRDLASLQAELAMEQQGMRRGGIVASTHYGRHDNSAIS